MQERFTKGAKAALSYAKQIAKELGVGKGEVQLIIGMQERLCRVG